METYLIEIIEKNIDKIKNFKKILGGLSNKLYKCGLENSDLNVLIKEYGKSDFIIRDIELDIFKELEKYNFVPKLYHSFTNGYIMEYLECEPIQFDEFINLKYKNELIKNMIKYHEIQLDIKKTESIIIKYGNSIINTLNIDNLTFSDIKVEWENISSKIILLDEPLYVCHNDLQQFNLLKNTQGKLYFIDFEYSGYNSILYEIANLFNEFLFNYNIDNDPYFQYTNKNKINEDQKFIFIEDYYKTKNQSIDLQYVKEIFYLYELQSHLFWTIWSLNLVNNNHVKFNYYEYAKIRYRLYKEGLK